MEREAEMEQAVTQAGERVADKTVAAAARTTHGIRQEGVGGVVEDLETLIRRYPMPALLLGLGCGYLLSRAQPN
ncbi:MAG TPA: hypothetical protein DCQ94_10975 [Nitrospira sp.]|nr:hypothetical protein [Nitrospira sp.]